MEEHLSNLSNLLNLPGVAVQSCHCVENSVYFNLNIFATGINCQHCWQYTEELHQVRPIIVRDLPAFGKQVYLNLPRRQFYCRYCQRYITEQLEFINWRRKYTKRYEQSVYYQVNTSSVEQVSKQENLGIDQVRNIINNFTHRRECKQQLCVTRLEYH